MEPERLDVQLELVSDVQRRELLLSLLERSPQDDGARSGGVSMRDDGRRRQIQMKHVHLPKLAAADLVNWDREAGACRGDPTSRTSGRC